MQVITPQINIFELYGAQFGFVFYLEFDELSKSHHELTACTCDAYHLHTFSLN